MADNWDMGKVKLTKPEQKKKPVVNKKESKHYNIVQEKKDSLELTKIRKNLQELTKIEPEPIYTPRRSRRRRNNSIVSLLAVLFTGGILFVIGNTVFSFSDVATNSSVLGMGGFPFISLIPILVPLFAMVYLASQLSLFDNIF